MKIYFADFSFGSPELASYDIERETLKTHLLSVASKVDIIGRPYTTHSARKGDERVFFTEYDAVRYLIGRAEDRIEFCKTDMEKHSKQISELSSILEAKR